MNEPSEQAKSLVAELVRCAAEWGGTMHETWHERSRAAEDALVEFVAGQETALREAVDLIRLGVDESHGWVYGDLERANAFAERWANLATPPDKAVRALAAAAVMADSDPTSRRAVNALRA